MHYCSGLEPVTSNFQGLTLPFWSWNYPQSLPMHNHPAHSHHCLQRPLPHTVGTDGHQNMPQEAEMTEKRIKLNYQRAVAPPAMLYMLRAGLLAAHQAHCRTSPASAGLLRSPRPDQAPAAGPYRSGQCWWLGQVSACWYCSGAPGLPRAQAPAGHAIAMLIHS